MSDLLCSRKVSYLLSKLSKTLATKFIRVTRKSLPIIVLGLIHVNLAKRTDYPVNFSLVFFFIFVESFFYKEHERNTDGIGIFISLLRFFLSSRFYFISFFCIFP